MAVLADGDDRERVGRLGDLGGEFISQALDRWAYDENHDAEAADSLLLAG